MNLAHEFQITNYQNPHYLGARNSAAGREVSARVGGLMFTAGLKCNDSERVGHCGEIALRPGCGVNEIES